jgi:RNA polymerase sigma factor (sigma-70 family)
MNENFDNRDDRSLVEKCLKGLVSAQESLYKRYYRLIMGICMRYAGNRDEAKEILQEGFIKIFNNLETFKFEGSLDGWVKRIVVNTAIDYIRKRNIEPKTIEINDNLPFNESIVETMNKDDLIKCINQLPAGYRSVFNMYVIEGFSHKEIAEKLGITEGTSKSQLSKAKEFLKGIIFRMTSIND